MTKRFTLYEHRLQGADNERSVTPERIIRTAASGAKECCAVLFEGFYRAKKQTNIGAMSRILHPQVLTVWITLISRATADLICDTLLLLSTNLTARTLILWNQTSSPTTSSGLFCNTSIDGIGTCWPRSSAGEVVSRPCPETFLGVRYNTTNNVYRECLTNGTWAKKGNYSQCQEILNEEKKGKLHYHIAVIINYLGHCISLGALLVAFILFMRLRSIRCLRNIIHWNLITAFILRNATWFVVQLTMNPEVHESNVFLRVEENVSPPFTEKPQIWCRLVTAAYNYFHVTNFFWMFGEGCYLHTAIVLTYSTDKLRKWMFICIGWCIPFPIIVAWAIGKLYYDNEKCWFGKRAGIYTDYIYQGPMILVLLINFIFLFNIVRILMTKLRASTTSETIQYRKAVKATLVLLPLLGITYMLFFVNPGEDEISQIVFIYFNSFLESFQGFFVSVFYCFLNSEVRSAVRKRWHRWQDKHSIRARVARAMSIPTSPTRVSFHSIKQSSAV
ncbi:corticotropin-releasing factor receptor 1 isoform X1 [Myxocyprinus asiaticus]|uniref:corticotropin-releasing factor receptor 1 isoform X1 n=1 Tax=Myxocyprinus asiaticus TaxID=70543 RepID=UPI0022234622|nr:corticotropin-releasing factor receptor 1 isoform X1 [Myxocyprinus asiaticus]